MFRKKLRETVGRVAEMPHQVGTGKRDGHHIAEIIISMQGAHPYTMLLSKTCVPALCMEVIPQNKTRSIKMKLGFICTPYSDGGSIVAESEGFFSEDGEEYSATIYLKPEIADRFKDKEVAVVVYVREKDLINDNTLKALEKLNDELSKDLGNG